MSYQALAWAWRQDIPSSRKFVLVALADSMNHRTGQCNPSLSTLAAKVGKTPRAVQYDLLWLESHDVICRASRRRSNDSCRSNNYVLFHQGDEAGFTGGTKPTSPLELELEPEEEPKDAPTAHGESEAMDAYEDIWGSAAEREAQRQAQQRRQAKERLARARKTALAARPRSEWRPGHLEDFFRSQVTLLSLPRQPQLDQRAMRGAFQALLGNGHKPEDLAKAIEDFLADRSLWSDLVERQGAPIWKVFLKLAPTLSTRTAAAPAAREQVSENRLPGMGW